MTNELQTRAAPDLLATFLAGRNEQTLRAYQSDLQTFRGFVDVATVPEAVAALLAGGQGAANGMVLRFRAYLFENKRAPASVNRALSALRALVKLARMLGVVSWTLDVPNVAAEPYRDTRGPGLAGVKKLLATTEGKEEGNTDAATLRDRAILRLLYDLGLRRAEAASLDIGDVDLPRGTVSVMGKRRRTRTLLTLPPATAQAVADWLAVRGAEPGALFLNFDHAQKGAERRLTPHSIYRIVRGRGQSVGIKVAPHGLRHTAITEACKAAHAAGIPLEEVMDFSRHRDVKILMIYRDRERDMQGQIATLVSHTTNDNSG